MHHKLNLFFLIYNLLKKPEFEWYETKPSKDPIKNKAALRICKTQQLSAFMLLLELLITNCLNDAIYSTNLYEVQTKIIYQSNNTVDQKYINEEVHLKMIHGGDRFR